MPPQNKDEIYEKITGNFLLARLNVKGIFERSVVWISAFAKDAGARGIIINKPMMRRLAECTPTFAGTPLAQIPMFAGGPVEENRLAVLACIRNFLTGGNEIQIGLPPDKIRDLAHNPAASLMAFAGHAEWQPGQLENEIASGTWLHTRIDFALWLNENPENLWRKLLEQSKKLDAQILLRAPLRLEEN